MVQKGAANCSFVYNLFVYRYQVIKLQTHTDLKNGANVVIHSVT